MKKLLLVCFLFSFQFSNAQVWGYEGAEWHYGFSVFYTGFYNFHYTSDTLINDINCQKIEGEKHTFIIQSNGTYVHQQSITSPRFTYYSGDTVFYQGTNGDFFQLFNFGAEVGDRWIIDKNLEPWDLCDTISQVEVIETGVVTINGEILRTITLETLDNSLMIMSGTIIERIGPVGGLFLFPTYTSCDPEIVVDFEQKFFRCYSDNSFAQHPESINCEYWLSMGLEDMDLDPYKIYPNPTKDLLTIENLNQNELKVSIFSLDGNLILKQLNSREKLIPIQLNSLQNGVYFMILESNGNQFIEKIIIE